MFPANPKAFTETRDTQSTEQLRNHRNGVLCMNVKLSQHVKFFFPEAVRNTVQVLCALALWIHTSVHRAGIKEELGDCQ